MIPWIDILWCIIIAISVKLFLFVIQRRQEHQRFQKRAIPGPKPSLLAGNMFQLDGGKELAHATMDKWFREYGDFFGYYRGECRYLVIRDLEILRTIFIEKASSFRNRPPTVIEVEPLKWSVVFTRDDDWKRIRKTVSPVFGLHKVQSPEIIDIIEKCASSFADSLRKKATWISEDGRSFEVGTYRRVQATSLDIIARTSLNMDSVNVHDDKDTLVNAVRQYFSEAQNAAVNAATLLPFLRPLMAFINDYFTAGTMTDLIVKHIKQKITEASEVRGQGVKSTTFLDSLLNNHEKGRLSENEVIANGHIILLAGYETTGTSVTFLFYLLGAHPEIQEKLRSYFRQEQNSEEDYFEMVWLEALRIYPPVIFFVSRQASEDVDLGSIYIEEGTIVQAPVWQIHHDPTIWLNPYQFDPERFSPEKRKEMHPMAFLAFGVGPRICLGSHLATQEARLITQAVLSKYRIMTTDKNRNGVPLVEDITFVHPADEVLLRFEML